MKTELLIEEIRQNPDNPRVIKDENFIKLVKSIKEFPEMLDVREVVLNTDHIILGGNMRYLAAIEAGLTKIPVKIVDWTAKKQAEFVAKDNASFGDWNYGELVEQFTLDELSAWAIDVPEGFIDIDYSDSFSLGDSDKVPYGQMTFMLADEQKEEIESALRKGKDIDGETFGNDNKNGNVLYWIIKEWLTK